MISLCITTYNRTDKVLRAFEQVLDNPAISEIVIVDDCSDIEKYDKLKFYINVLAEPKIKLYRNDHNLDCYRNKKRSVELATNEWCIVFDSDNIMTDEYLHKLSLEYWDKSIIYAPDFAKPNFDYRHLATGELISKFNVAWFVDQPKFDCLINTFNCFVNRKSFLEVWDGSIDPHTADSAYFNLCWIKSGKSIKVVKGMEYDHEVHDGSHYVNNVHKTGTLFEDIIKEFKTMKV